MDRKEKFLYLISIVFSKRKNNSEELITHIEAIKYDLNVNILEKSKTKINMPYLKEDDSENYSDENDEEENKSGGEKYNFLRYWNHYCIYRCIVQNVKNYSFILHGYRGPPFEAEWFWLVECEQGKIQTINQKAYQYLSSESSYVDYAFIKKKDNIISAFANRYDDAIEFD